MIKKSQTIFICKKCDAQYPKWSGRCLECGSWGTLEQETTHPSAPARIATQSVAGGSSGRSKKQPPRKSQNSNYKAGEVVELFQGNNSKPIIRLKTDFEEFDKVLGNGMVEGSLILLGGDPGVGKSTLALQVAAESQLKSLYISAEEIETQVTERLSRLKSTAKIKFLHEDSIETIIATIIKENPQLVIVDSIQTVFTEEVDSEAGSINQVRACTVKLLEVAKNQNISIILVGHVTKGGQVAGPKTLEHLVDTVLYLEGDKYRQYRLLRATKNRFGSTDEVGILKMAKEGLQPVKNPSKIFLAEAHNQPGSVITAVAEGSQVFLVEVQALVSKTTSGYPKRQASGFDQKRLELLSTVITKRAGINLTNFDVYLNIAGGLILKEPSMDLAVITSIISAWQDKTAPKETVIFGEVGLAGEVRSVTKTKERVKEAQKLGFKKIILPFFESQVKDVELIKVKEVTEILKLFKTS